MVIAVYINSLPASFVNTNFHLESFLRLAQQYSKHEFIFIADNTIDEKLAVSKNIIPVNAGTAPKNPLLLQYRLNYTIPALLRKHKANVFVSTGGLCSLRAKIPQCVIVNDLSFLNHTKFYSSAWLRFYKKNTVKFLTGAKKIIASSLFVKDEIVEHYKISAEKIDIAYPSPGEYFTPVSWQEKEVIKTTYADGREYFFYNGPIHPTQNLTALLKAFSFFKKRQKSNMQLVIASTHAAADDAFIKSLASFKYRHEVKLLDHLPEAALAKINGAAYALVYPFVYKGIVLPLAQAMQSDVPVITADTVLTKEICGDAGMYLNGGDVNDIAEKMMLIFKDEGKRNELIVKGRLQAALYHWNKSGSTIWEAILKCSG